MCRTQYAKYGGYGACRHHQIPVDLNGGSPVRPWAIAFLGAILSLSIETSINRADASNIRLEIMGRCLGLKGEPAIKACTSVIQSPRAWPSEIAMAHATRGWLYIHGGRVQKDDDASAVFQSWGGDNGRRAAADFDQAIALDPSVAPEAFACRGFYSFLSGKPESAVDDFTHAINLNPPKGILCNSLLQRAYNYQLLSMIKSESTQRDLSIEDFSQVIRLCPEKKIQSLAFMGRAQLYRLHKHQYDLAIDDLTAAIRINPRDSQAFYDRALAEKELGRIVDAERDIQAARRIDPSIGN